MYEFLFEGIHLIQLDLTRHSHTLGHQKFRVILTLVRLVLPPKKLDSRVSIRLKNDDANFEEASFWWEGGNRLLQTPETLQTRGQSRTVIEVLRISIVVYMSKI